MFKEFERLGIKGLHFTSIMVGIGPKTTSTLLYLRYDA